MNGITVVVVWMKREIIPETKSNMKETEKNLFYSHFLSLSYLFWCLSFIPHRVIGWFLSCWRKASSAFQNHMNASSWWCACDVERKCVIEMWLREKEKRKEKKENVLPKDFLSKKDFRQNGRMFSSEWKRWWTTFSTGQGLSKWGWSVCFLGSFALHMARMMFGEKGKRSFFFHADCDCVYCREHTRWYSCCFSTNIPPNNLSQSFFEQKWKKHFLKGFLRQNTPISTLWLVHSAHIGFTWLKAIIETVHLIKLTLFGDFAQMSALWFVQNHLTNRKFWI